MKTKIHLSLIAILYFLSLSLTNLFSETNLYSWGDNYNNKLGIGLGFCPHQIGTSDCWVQITGGYIHTLLLKNDGTVWSCGSNYYGQLGNGTTNPSTELVQVSGLTGVVEIACGFHHSIALKSDGTVWTWGRNQYGQLGNGTTNNYLTPVQVSILTGVTAIAGGGYHSLALKSDGSAWAWGYNGYGQLGDGFTVSRSTPVPVVTLTGVTSIAGGGYHSLALKSDGSAWTWGYNGDGQLGNGTTTNSSTPVQVSILTGVTAIFGGLYHSMAFTTDGEVYTWGDNQFGQLGNGTYNDSYLPVYITRFPMGTGTTVTIAGSNQTIFLVDWMPSRGIGWGKNDKGQLGNGTSINVNEPIKFDFCQPVEPSSVAPSTMQIRTGPSFGSSYTISNGKAYSWGDNSYGQLGYETHRKTNPSKVEGYFEVDGSNVRFHPTLPAPYTTVSGSANHSLGATSDGRVLAWGSNWYCECGTGNNSPPLILPTQVPGLDNIVEVAGGFFHSLALKDDGTVWAWGYNYDGRLGLGYTSSPVCNPLQIPGLSGVAGIAAGYGHSCVTLLNGSVFCWGSNINGQLGDGTTTNRTSPQPVGLTKPAKKVSCGNQHTCVVYQDGTAGCWGDNNYGQLGNGTNVDSWVPVDVIGLYDSFFDITLGFNHTLAVLTGGDGVGWGWNYYGQLGDGTNINRNSPFTIIGLNNISELAAGYNHSMAKQQDNTVKSWGANSYGQLGNGTLVGSYTPVNVPSLINVGHIASGWNHSFAILNINWATIPTVTTSDIIDIQPASATCGGDVTSDGGAPVTQRGVCWKTSGNPTTSDFTTNDGSGIGAYPSFLTSLTPGTKYYVKAYAINSVGTAYGQEKSFCTPYQINITVTPERTVKRGELNTIYIGYGQNYLDLSGPDGYSYSWSTGETAKSIKVSPIITTTYELIVTNSNGCTAVSTVVVHVKDVRCGHRNEKKVNVCHYADPHPHTICIAAEAVPAHLDNHDYDYLGECVKNRISIPEEPSELSDLTLYQNNPNPFSRYCTIEFYMPEAGYAVLKIYDLYSREISTILSNNLSAGKHSIQFDGSNLPEGMYLYKLEVDDRSLSKTMMIIK